MELNILGVEAKALKLCEDRASLISGNIANSNTPYYKSKDFDFHAAMKKAGVLNQLDVTNEGHIEMNALTGGEQILYRVPMQYSVDENTVDDEIERKNFIQNAINYQASLGFAQHKTSQILKAIRGE